MRYLTPSKIAATAIAAIFTVACTPPRNIPPPPPKPIETAPVTPTVEAVKAQVAVQRATSEKLEGKVETLARTTGELRTGLAAATAEAARLRDAKTATESELDGIWRMLQAEQNRAAEMFAAADESRKLADDQRKQRIEAEKRLADLTTAAALRDSETANLRKAVEQMAKQIEAARDAEATMQASLAKAERKAAVGSYLKGIVWFLGIAAFLAFALWLATKFRLI